MAKMYETPKNNYQKQKNKTYLDMGVWLIRIFHVVLYFNDDGNDEHWRSTKDTGLAIVGTA